MLGSDRNKRLGLALRKMRFYLRKVGTQTSHISVGDGEPGVYLWEIEFYLFCFNFVVVMFRNQCVLVMPW